MPIIRAGVDQRKRARAGWLRMTAEAEKMRRALDAGIQADAPDVTIQAAVGKTHCRITITRGGHVERRVQMEHRRATKYLREFVSTLCEPPRLRFRGYARAVRRLRMHAQGLVFLQGVDR